MLIHNLHAFLHIHFLLILISASCHSLFPLNLFRVFSPTLRFYSNELLLTCHPQRISLTHPLSLPPFLWYCSAEGLCKPAQCLICSKASPGASIPECITSPFHPTKALEFFRQEISSQPIRAHQTFWVLEILTWISAKKGSLFGIRKGATYLQNLEPNKRFRFSSAQDVGEGLGFIYCDQIAGCAAPLWIIMLFNSMQLVNQWYLLGFSINLVAIYRQSNRPRLNWFNIYRLVWAV